MTNNVQPTIDIKTATPYFDAIILLAEDASRCSEIVRENFFSREMNELVQKVGLLLERNRVGIENDLNRAKTSSLQSQQKEVQKLERYLAEELIDRNLAKQWLHTHHPLLLERVEYYRENKMKKPITAESEIDTIRSAFNIGKRAQQSIIDEAVKELTAIEIRLHGEEQYITEAKKSLLAKRPRTDDFYL